MPPLPCKPGKLLGVDVFGVVETGPGAKDVLALVVYADASHRSQVVGQRLPR